jgi:hypothetical protein
LTEPAPARRRPADYRPSHHQGVSYRSARRAKPGGLSPIGYEELVERLRSGRNTAWASRMIGPEGAWPERTFFFITREPELSRGGRAVRVDPDEAKFFADALRERSLQAWEVRAHPANLLIRRSAVLARMRPGEKWTALGMG